MSQNQKAGAKIMDILSRPTTEKPFTIYVGQSGLPKVIHLFPFRIYVNNSQHDLSTNRITGSLIMGLAGIDDPTNYQVYVKRDGGDELLELLEVFPSKQGDSFYTHYKNTTAG
jgi:hypothetical protein